MTSTASSKGDVGAEMLSSQIGAYFDLAIRIIEYHGGDVVKVSPILSSLFCYLHSRSPVNSPFIMLFIAEKIEDN